MKTMFAAVSFRKGVDTVRLSAPNTTTDYSSYVTRVPGDADIVFFPTQKPGDAQTFARQLVEQGKKAKVFGGDGSNDPSQFKTPGAYVSNFAPDITGIPGDRRSSPRGRRTTPAGSRLVRSADLRGRSGPPEARSRRRASRATARSPTGGRSCAR